MFGMQCGWPSLESRKAFPLQLPPRQHAEDTWTRTCSAIADLEKHFIQGIEYPMWTLRLGFAFAGWVTPIQHQQ